MDWKKLYPYVTGGNVHDASEWYENYLNCLNNGKPDSMGAVLNLLKLLDQASDIIINLLCEADKKGHELERYGHREDCPLRGMGHWTNVITADGKEKISIIQNIDRKLASWQTSNFVTLSEMTQIGSTSHIVRFVVAIFTSERMMSMSSKRAKRHQLIVCVSNGNRAQNKRAGLIS